ncbi:hypothetical protein CERSUDRAFT_118436 [Gelatoporia subvermispora B]|uniref:Uncharacterized protein n=1 Tax=Ceriporiopsis subvermispora (strain B) TaxID=914234 RepID=M2PBR4_CERS8|nr:hypothetical protein CERSUDRAFT_118436 [Gelatoporia subvermispora B]
MAKVPDLRRLYQARMQGDKAVPAGEDDTLRQQNATHRHVQKPRVRAQDAPGVLGSTRTPSAYYTRELAQRPAGAPSTAIRARRALSGLQGWGDDSAWRRPPWRASSMTISTAKHCRKDDKHGTEHARGRFLPFRDAPQAYRVRCELSAAAGGNPRQRADASHHRLSLIRCAHPASPPPRLPARSLISHGILRISPKRHATRMDYQAPYVLRPRTASQRQRAPV